MAKRKKAPPAAGDGQLGFKALEDKRRKLEDGFPEAMALRVKRALSWIERAEQLQGDDDARFLFLWIAFNAAYVESRDARPGFSGEREVFHGYFSKIVELDGERRIMNAIWTRFPGPVRLLLENRYVYQPFWSHHHGAEGSENWEDRLKASARAFAKAFQDSDAAIVLSFVFDRLYVLRNQIVHGGAGWKGEENRDQVRDGARVLAFLVPVFVDIMMDNPDQPWGPPHYPLV